MGREKKSVKVAFYCKAITGLICSRTGKKYSKRKIKDVLKLLEKKPSIHSFAVKKPMQ